MNIIWDPKEIEKRSMEIIESHLQDSSFSPIEKLVVKRVIHTTGDPGIASLMRFHPQAIAQGLQALRGGTNIYTDVNMLRAGINQNSLTRYGGQVFCSIGDAETVERAQKWGITRAAASMRHLGEDLDKGIVAIGNAPTALFEVLDMIRQGICRPALIVGTPVGFVGAAESKELLVAQEDTPYISLVGTRGGSPIAVSIINALLYSEGGSRDA